MAQLQGKVAIVTGAGSGIGRAIALGFAAEGASVVVADVNSNAAEGVAAEIGEQALAVKCDVSQTPEVNAMVEAAVKRFDRLDILVNNAGRARGGPGLAHVRRRLGRRLHDQRTRDVPLLTRRPFADDPAAFRRHHQHRLRPRHAPGSSRDGGIRRIEGSRHQFHAITGGRSRPLRSARQRVHSRRHGHAVLAPVPDSGRYRASYQGRRRRPAGRPCPDGCLARQRRRSGDFRRHDQREVHLPRSE